MWQDVFFSSNRHTDIRTAICDYLETNFEVADLAADGETREQYVARMRRAGEWGGQPEIFAAANILRRNIYAFTAFGVQLLGAPQEGTPHSAGPLFIIHRNGNHWQEALVPEARVGEVVAAAARNS